MTRKEELLKQRNLVASHLAWLDQELAKTEGQSAPVPTALLQSAPAPADAGTVASPAPLPTPAAPAQPANAEVEALTEQLLREQTENTSKSVGEVKRGCLQLFAAALLALFALFFLGYWFRYRH